MQRVVMNLISYDETGHAQEAGECMRDRAELLAHIDRLTAERDAAKFCVSRAEGEANAEREAKKAAVKRADAAEAEIKRLREALELLHSVQNGSPLYKYEADWNKAMEMTAALLWPEPTNTTPPEPRP